VSWVAETKTNDLERWQIQQLQGEIPPPRRLIVDGVFRDEQRHPLFLTFLGIRDSCYFHWLNEAHA
jgi:hypothetical protein